MPMYVLWICSDNSCLCKTKWVIFITTPVKLFYTKLISQDAHEWNCLLSVNCSQFMEELCCPWKLRNVDYTTITTARIIYKCS